MKRKRKILWFSGSEFSDEKIKTTGTWLIAMGNALIENEDIELYNVTNGEVASITQKNVNNITQWIVPYRERKKYSQGSRKLVSFIKKIDNEIKPDLIHVWGTETGFGIDVIEAKLETPVLLEIQGLLFAYVRYYYGGLSNKDLFNCIGLKEIVRPKFHPYFNRRRFEKKGKHELRLIRQMENISVQSGWVDSIIKYVAPESNIFHTGMMLRSEFYAAPSWKYQEENEVINIFTSSSGAIPYKGLQVLFEAIALLKDKYPTIRLNIGGDMQINRKYGLIRDGYTSWLLKRANQLGIADSISWMGKMDANEMISQMHESSMVVVPSFVETYCLFMAEAMMVGVPIVASYAAALPELAEHGTSALYFPTGDHWACAEQIEKIITDQDLSVKLSVKSRNRALQRNEQEKVLRKQLEIYDKIIGEF